MIVKDKGNRKRRKHGRKAKGLEEEDKRKCFAADEDAAKMLNFLEDSEDLKVRLGELKEQLESPEEAGNSLMQVAKQARNERGQKLFQIFRQEENEVSIASLARWDTQLKRVGGAGKVLSGNVQEVKLLSARDEVLTGLWMTRSDYRVKRPRSIKKQSSRS